MTRLLQVIVTVSCSSRMENWQPRYTAEIIDRRFSSGSLILYPSGEGIHMSFPQFAFNNIRRNGRAYIAFFLSSVFMVMIFFAYGVFIYHPYVAELPMGDTTATGMQIASVIVYVFAFFFVMYSISAFLKSRNKEFGILT